MYLRFWMFALFFTAFWVLYGFFVFLKKLLIENNFDIQPLYLILGMLLLFFQSKKEYIKAEKGLDMFLFVVTDMWIMSTSK